MEDNSFLQEGLNLPLNNQGLEAKGSNSLAT